MMPCSQPGCGRLTRARGLCSLHYQVARYRGQLAQHPAKHAEYDRWVNPLVCVCRVPDADPARDFGMCQTCKRKPLALMVVAR